MKDTVSGEAFTALSAEYRKLQKAYEALEAENQTLHAAFAPIRAECDKRGLEIVQMNDKLQDFEKGYNTLQHGMMVANDHIELLEKQIASLHAELEVYRRGRVVEITPLPVKGEG